MSFGCQFSGEFGKFFVVLKKKDRMLSRLIGPGWSTKLVDVAVAKAYRAEIPLM
jgi:hypothetical protein